jgi:carboxyl-terminal processing protease
MERLVTILAITLCSSPIFTSSVSASPATDLMREASFYLEFYYNGPSSVNLKELTARYNKQLENACVNQGEACTFDTARGFITRMLSEVGDGHTYYLFPNNFASAINQYAGINPDTRSVYGLSLSRSNERGEVLISEVRSGGVALEAGLQPGDRIERIGAQKLVGANAANDLRSKLETEARVRVSILRGDPANPKKLSVTLTKKPIINPNLPYLYAPAVAPAGVMVIRFPSFVGFNDIGPKTFELVNQARSKNARALILDVRGNGGGEETECITAAAAFTGSVELAMKGRLETVKLGFKDGATFGNDPRDPRSYRVPNATPWTGSVAVLTDEGTASCGEVLAYLIQRAKRGPIVGARTRGVLNSATDFFQLIDRSAVAITYVRTLNSDGTPLPEFITPDVDGRSNLDLWASSGRDALLETALTALNIK